MRIPGASSFFFAGAWLSLFSVSAFFLFFNFSSSYATQNDLGYESFTRFKKNWEVNQAIYSQFLDYLDSDSISFIADSLEMDRTFINNRIKSEIAGTIWGKDESASIRLALDNQVSEALKYFNEANAFLGYRN